MKMPLKGELNSFRSFIFFLLQAMTAGCLPCGSGQRACRLVVIDEELGQGNNAAGGLVMERQDGMNQWTQRALHWHFGEKYVEMKWDWISSLPRPGDKGKQNRWFCRKGRGSCPTHPQTQIYRVKKKNLHPDSNARLNGMAVRAYREHETGPLQGRSRLNLGQLSSIRDIHSSQVPWCQHTLKGAIRRDYNENIRNQRLTIMFNAEVILIIFPIFLYPILFVSAGPFFIALVYICQAL